MQNFLHEHGKSTRPNGPDLYAYRNQSVGVRDAYVPNSACPTATVGHVRRRATFTFARISTANMNE